jgi:hypothetical protein
VVLTLQHANGRTSRWLRPRDQQNIPNIPEPAGTRIATLG